MVPPSPTHPTPVEEVASEAAPGRSIAIVDASARATDTRLFVNRELSWISFNERVLEEARDAALPLYERLKFLGIVGSNLDEFFMVRVAGLKQQILGNVLEVPADGMTPAEQLVAISTRVHALVAEQHRAWREEVQPGLVAVGVGIVDTRSMTSAQRAFVREHFARAVFPALTPLAIDQGHPFPHLRNKSLNVAVLLRRSAEGRRRSRRADAGAPLLAVVQVPSMLGRLVRLPSSEGLQFALLEEILAANAADIFPGYAVLETAPFRVTRNWDIEFDEDESDDLLSTIQAELRRRDRGRAVRLELAADASDAIERGLAEALDLDARDVYRLAGPLQLPDLGALCEAEARPELRAEPHQPRLPASLRGPEPMVEAITRGDVLLHHPYESFEPVVRFIEEAAEDPGVLAIKQTLYRTSGDSPFVRALSRAAENGKQVTALVELRARFDEANNIAWARRLEENGVHVVYGVVGLKTHCKVALVVRREGAGIRRYLHLGTGNYNPSTARQYTDLSLFSARPELAEDVSALFNMLTGYSEQPPWQRLTVSPRGLQEKLVALIAGEMERARAGQPARIVAKMNALVDPVVIRALYAASQAGVAVDLLVRGICCLRPGVPGLSERIRVTSVVDRFLEHSRVFAFGTGRDAEVYLSSADWMPRNFHRRIEVMFPVEDGALKARLLDEVLGVALADDTKARRLLPDGSYERLRGGKLRSQSKLAEAARATETRPEALLRPLPSAH